MSGCAGSAPSHEDIAPSTGSEDGSGPASPHDGGAKKAGDAGEIRLKVGDQDGGSAGADAGTCTGISIGPRCVKKEHLSFIEASPQFYNDGTLVYDFDKSYENLGALKKNKPKIAPSAELGEWYLYNGDYVRIGVSYDSFVNTGGKVADKDRLPQREGRNKDLAWSLNAVKALDNTTDLAAPNCTVCHYNYFADKLVPGLGRNKHWIATDASGFTLNVFGIGLNSVFAGDTGATLVQDLGLLTRLFPDTVHSHLFDLFAALAMRHEPDTLKWTGNLDGDPNSYMKGWIDFPAWWNSKKKNAVYANGSGRGHLSNHLWYMNWFSLDGIAEAEEIINNFIHVQAFLHEKIKAPKFEDFGGKIDKALAAKGEPIFLEHCATCHGTYAENEEDETYPSALVDVDEVGTDPTLATNHWIYPVLPWFEKSWYVKNDPDTKIVKTHGYMAPPLDGLFMTAPYFHNGSVPTVEAVIDPSKRPDTWMSNMSPDDYDYDALGWKNKPLDLDIWTLDLHEGLYLTSDAGNSNKGHTYGAVLTAEEKKALLEYLKTL
ncbi:MAG TPA: hypothetical protein VI299_07830 [Polyangiales bacterium]